MKKIEKLDRVLSQKMETEREVKRERFALERNFQQQIKQLIHEKGVENVVGSHQLLSLCATSEADQHRRESLMMEDVGDFTDPIFTTQIDSQFYDRGRNSSSNSKTQLPDNIDDEIGSTTSDNDKGQSGDKKRSKKKVDFIKRNVNLASHFNETVALTDEEKARLEELLSDENDLLIGENPFSTPSLRKEDGFQLSLENQEHMEEIDSKLRDFLTEDEYNVNILGESLSSSVGLHSLQGDHLNSAAEVRKETILLSMKGGAQDAWGTIGNNAELCGEAVLNERITQRNMVQRLCDIEKRLKELRVGASSPTSTCCDDNVDYDDDGNLLNEHRVAATIDPDLLRALLDVDSRLTSDSKSICDSVRTNSVVCYDGGAESDYDDVRSVISVVTAASNDIGGDGDEDAGNDSDGNDSDGDSELQLEGAHYYGSNETELVPHERDSN